MSHTYDAAGHVASIRSPNAHGASMSYPYDDLNRLSTGTNNQLTGSNVTTYANDAFLREYDVPRLVLPA